MRRKLIAILLIVSGLSLLVFTLIRNNTNLTEVSVLPSGEEVVVQNSDFIEPSDLTKHENKIVIDKIGVEAEILEGGIEQLAKGVWHLPRTSNPKEGGNTVITAHRWKYRPPDPRTFYNLDKMDLGDSITIFWEGDEYKYIVKDIFEVTPDKVEILAPSDEAELTLFTCTPLFSTDRRLVIKARLESVSSSTASVMK